MDESDLLSYVLSGLNAAFTPFVTSMSFALRHCPMDFDDFQSELLSYEIMIENKFKFGKVVALKTELPSTARPIQTSKYQATTTY